MLVPKNEHFFIHCKSKGISSARRLHITNSGNALLYLITRCEWLFKWFFIIENVSPL